MERKDFCEFINFVIEENNIHLKRNVYYIIDSADISIKSAKEILKNSLIIPIGCKEISAQDLKDKILKHDTKLEWTYGYEEKEVLDISKEIINNSIKLYNECILNNICYFDTSIDRYETYNSLNKSLYNCTVEIIKELKNKGYKVGLLSNLRLMDYKRYENEIKKINFDYVFLSYEMKCMKPSKDIYLLVIDTLNCEADKIIFFDDNEKNVNGAKSIGINAYQVTGRNIKENFYKIINNLIL